MRRAGNLISRIVEPDNMRLAWLKTIRGKRTSSAVLRFCRDLDTNLSQIAAELCDGSYVWGTFSRFTIFDPKEREISVAPLRDRIAYHAICNVCTPVFERYQIDQSCACRKGKGQTEAIRLAMAYTRANSWYLKLDVRKYFDSVSHDVLGSLLARLFKDRCLLDLFGSLIDSYHTKPGRGIPIGSLTSQFFANHYLGILDHFIKEKLRCRAYVRYMDDFILWDNRKGILQGYWEEIDRFLTGKLQLTLKTPSLNRTKLGLSFLGYRLFPGHLRLARRSRTRLRNRYRKALLLFEKGVWDESAFARHVGPLFAFAARAESVRFRRRVIGKWD